MTVELKIQVPLQVSVQISTTRSFLLHLHSIGYRFILTLLRINLSQIFSISVVFENLRHDIQ